MFTPEQLLRLRDIASVQLPATASPDARERARKFLDDDVISSAQFGDQQFENGSVWLETSGRAHERYLHGFLFFIDWTRTLLEKSDARSEESARAAVRVISRWMEMHPSPERSPGMAYHDETTAQRLIVLISIYPALVSAIGEPGAAPAKSLLQSTAEILARDDFHAGNNNHGMFQDLALLYYSLLHTDDPQTRDQYFQLALRRLRQYFTSCFTADGVHVENAPTYHLMVSRQLANVQKIAQAAGHEDAGYYSSLIQKAETYAAHAVMPNGIYPPISDTQQVDTSRSGMGKIFPGSAFEYASTQGRRGTAPESRVLVLPDSGYAIYRSSWDDPDAVFAFFSAAYNADYHKHSDDLSFFLRSGGRDLLSESGPYGYDYKHPFSRYAYSQYSHNSLVVDGKSLPRTDALKDQVYLQREDETTSGFTVRGINGRYPDTIHSRRVQVSEPGGTAAFTLTDVITSSSSHDYQLLWNLGLEVRAHLTEDGFDLVHEHTTVMQLRVRADVPIQLSVHEGEHKPRPLGWRFPRFGEALPTQVVVISFQGTAAELTTDIRLSEFDEHVSVKGQVKTEGAADAPVSHRAPTPHTIQPGPSGTSIHVAVSLPANTQSAFRLYRGTEPVSFARYSTTHAASFDDLLPGRYRVRVFERHDSDSRTAIFTTNWVQL